MKITSTMDLWQLAERMGTGATVEDADYMRERLIATGCRGMDTETMPVADWDVCLQESVANRRAVERKAREG